MKSALIIILRFLFSFLVVFLFLFCKESEKPKTLSYTKRKKIDSLFLINQPMIDSSISFECEQMKKDRLDYWVDSLYGIRMEEIEKLKNN